MNNNRAIVTDNGDASDAAASATSSTSGKDATFSYTLSSAEVEDNKYLIEQIECTNGWIECFCVVKFDLELGQKIEQVYPSSKTFSKTQELDISYLSFPDSNASSVGDTMFVFRIRDEEYNTYILQKKRSNSNGSSGSSSSNNNNSNSGGGASSTTKSETTNVKPAKTIPLRRARSEEECFLYGCVYFRQQKDKSIHRGYLQKSILVISRYPFVELLKDIIKVVGPTYFENAASPAQGHTDADNAVFMSAMQAINKWPPPRTDQSYELPFLYTVINYRSPHFSLPLHTMSRVLHQQRKSGSDWISDEEERQRLVEVQHSKKNGKGSVAPVTNLKARLGGRKYLFQEVNIIESFRGTKNLEYLWRCWELAILGEPLIVLSQTPTQCCNAVMAIISLVAPLSWAGDFRPYFTVHDSQFKQFSLIGKNQPLRPIIIGVTNPFFIKAYEKWPHLISIGMNKTGDAGSSGASSPPLKKGGVGLTGGSDTAAEAMKRNKSGGNIPSLLSNFNSLLGGGSSSGSSGDSNSKESLVWEFKEHLFSKRRFVIKIDEQVIKTLTLLPQASPTSSSTNSRIKKAPKEIIESVNNDIIRKHFEQLTESFLQPLQMCFDSLWYSIKSPSFIFRSEHDKIFMPSKFYEYIQKHGYNNEIFSGKRSEVLDFYMAFIKSINFRVWLKERIREAYSNDIRYTPDIDNILRSLTEVQSIDLFLRLSSDLEEEVSLLQCDPMVCKRLTEFLDQIRARLPEDLRPALRRLKMPDERNTAAAADVQNPESSGADNDNDDDYIFV